LKTIENYLDSGIFLPGQRDSRNSMMAKQMRTNVPPTPG